MRRRSGPSAPRPRRRSRAGRSLRSECVQRRLTRYPNETRHVDRRHARRKLAVVSRDLSRAVPVPHIARRLQDALDDWPSMAPKLAAAARTIDSASGIPFNPIACMSPLPRASLGRWLRLSESRRTCPQGARRDHAARVSRRSAHVPGQFGPVSGAASRSSSPTRLGASTSKAKSPSSPTMCRCRCAPDRAREAHSVAHAGQRRQLAQPDSTGAWQTIRLPTEQAGACVLAGRGHAR